MQLIGTRSISTLSPPNKSPTYRFVASRVRTTGGVRPSHTSRVSFRRCRGRSNHHRARTTAAAGVEAAAGARESEHCRQADCLAAQRGVWVSGAARPGTEAARETGPPGGGKEPTLGARNGGGGKKAEAAASPGGDLDRPKRDRRDR